VKHILEKHSIRNGKKWGTIIQLLEKRETSLRLSPILLVFCMLHKIGIVKRSNDNTDTSSTNQSVSIISKQNPNIESWIHYIDQLEQNLIKVVIHLLYYGASPKAKDICGRTVCFYGASIYATTRSLLATTMCINAAYSAHFFGKEIVIQDVETTTTKDEHQNDTTIRNGMCGLAGGYQVDTGRRIVFLFGHKTEVAVYNRNICLSNKSDNTCSHKTFNLCDVQDRLGHMCLTELFGSKRKDVIEFLLKKHYASIDVPDWKGQTLRHQSFTIKMNTLSKSEVLDDDCISAQIIVVEATKRARLEQRQVEHSCKACNCQLSKSITVNQYKPLQACQRWYVKKLTEKDSETITNLC
jgi:hypothetical protein